MDIFSFSEMQHISADILRQHFNVEHILFQRVQTMNGGSNGTADSSNIEDSENILMKGPQDKCSILQICFVFTQILIFLLSVK